MENTELNFQAKKSLLKETRLEFLRLHKLLVDIERENYEKLNGQVSSGQFLNLLVSDKNFEWLRKFSTLIVEIDEMFDLTDGFPEQMADKLFVQMREITSVNTSDDEFNDKYRNVLQTNAEVAGKHSELKKLLAK